MNLVCATCPVRDRAACSVLDDNERENLARRGHHRTLEAGEVLFRAGEKVNSCATLTNPCKAQQAICKLHQIYIDISFFKMCGVAAVAAVRCGERV